MPNIVFRPSLFRVLLTAVAACAVGAPPAAAQDHAHGAGTAKAHAGHGEPIVASEPGRIEVRHAPDSHDLVALLGPYSIPAHGNTMRLTPSEVVVVPVDGWLTRFRTRILDRQGNEMDREILHHINVVRPARRELFFPIMQRLAAAGQETGEIAVPFPFGVPVSAGDTLLIAAMLHNPTGEPIEIVVEASIHYDTPEWLDRKPVEPFHLDIEPPPAGASFDLPPGRSEQSWEGTPAIAAEVLALGGHVHRFAQELRLEEVQPDGSAKVLWRTAPELAPDGQIARVPRETFLLGGRLALSPERTYRLVAVYENPTGEVIRDGGMAEIAGVVRTAEPWPDADPSDPWFHADFVNFTRHNPALQGGGAAGDPHHHHQP